MSTDRLSTRIDQLAPPPRPVPLPVTCRAMLGIIGGIGAIFLVSGLVSVLIFSSGFHPLDELLLTRAPATAEGIITKVTPTNSTVNDVPVYRYEFTFRTPDGKEITASCYTTGNAWSVEDRVLVEYAPSKPTVARVEETRLSQFEPWLFLMIFIFPATGLGLVVPSVVRGLRQTTLLRWGEVAGGRVLSTQPTGTTVNDVSVMKYTYEFDAHDGETYMGSSKSLPTPHIGDETAEPVLYLPSNPRQSTLVDALPLGHPLDVDAYGQWATQESVRPVVWCAATLVATLVLIALIAVRLLGVP